MVRSYKKLVIHYYHHKNGFSESLPRLQILRLHRKLYNTKHIYSRLGAKNKGLGAVFKLAD